MAAWKHWNYWNDEWYKKYRQSVEKTAPTFRGRKEDCTDLSMTLIIEFAAKNGLPLTFVGNEGTRYISKGTRQTPKDRRGWLRTLTWNSLSSQDNFRFYLSAVLRRIDANVLFDFNTEVNLDGPEPGDLMLSRKHAALVFATYPPGTPHPKAVDKSIPDFPGPEKAAAELDQLEYFRDTKNRSGTPAKDVRHFDYLNHRGDGKPVKQKAELIYFASVKEMTGLRYEFREYNDTVLDDWADWNGKDDPKR